MGCGRCSVRRGGTSDSAILNLANGSIEFPQRPRDPTSSAELCPLRAVAQDPAQPRPPSNGHGGPRAYAVAASSSSSSISDGQARHVELLPSVERQYKQCSALQCNAITLISQAITDQQRRDHPQRDAVQRLRRASARPMAATVSGARTRPLRVMASICSQHGRAAREQLPARRPGTVRVRRRRRAASSICPTGPRWRSIHSRTTGSAVFHMSSFGSSVRADAFDHHHGLLQQQQFRARAHVEQAGHLEQQRQQLRHRDVFGRRPWIGSPMARIACAKLSTE